MGVAVLGSGALGFADAYHIARKNLGIEVLLYGRNFQLVSHLQGERTHPAHSPDVILPPNATPTSNLQKLAEAEVVFVDLPSLGITPVITELSKYAKEGVLMVNSCKGLVDGKLPLKAIAGAMGGKYAEYLARSGWMKAQNITGIGKSFADIASANEELAELVKKLLSDQNFNIRTSTDVDGVQLAGILKDIYAIYAGIFDGLGKKRGEQRLFGQLKRDAMQAAKREALIIGVLNGGKPETFSKGSYFELDYNLSCTRDTANWNFGREVGMGADARKLFEKTIQTGSRIPEGYGSVAYLSCTEVEPIINTLAMILFQGNPAEKVVEIRPEPSIISV